jgi:coenzyme F420-reducing hydrogenase gamma subunit
MEAGLKPKVAVYKFSSCDGCQLSILNLEDELLDLAGALDIAYFLEATSAVRPGPYDIALVEGSVSTPEEHERIRRIRQDADLLIALGTCATAGGVQALRNFADKDEFAEVVYQHPEYLDALETSTPIADHVSVDLELWGCPVNKRQVLEVVAALLQNRQPRLPATAVCAECKRAGTVCVMVAHGVPCLGPVTQAGCGALCPSKGRGCYGCFGPLPDAQMKALVPVLQRHERYPGEAVHLLRTISGYAPAFRQGAELLMAEEAEV